MTYPSATAYGEALQYPRTSILDSTLANGTVQTDALGMPRGLSGQFAFTYKVSVAGQHFAFRCFQSHREGVHERYTAISNASLASQLPYFVDFTYLDPGVRVMQQAYPAIRMEWAEGQTLGSFIEQHVHNSGRLRALQQQLHGMALALEGAGIAHGDIQSGNILVGPSGELKLVDYDGMFVPQLAGLQALENGHVNFQHPERATAQPFDATLDRFSFALLHATLSALIEQPILWQTLRGEPDAPLLRRADFDNPEQSDAFATLMRLPASGEIFQRLKSISLAPYQDVPAFGDFLAGRNIPTRQRTITRSSRPASATSRPTTDSEPWYRTQPANQTIPAYNASAPVIDASDQEACRRAIGTVVELVGKITDVELGDTAGGLPFAHLRLGTTLPTGPKAIIWAEGVQALTTQRRTPNAAWKGQYVSIKGQLELTVASATGPRVAITVTRADQLELLTPAVARLRLAAGPMTAPSVSVDAGSPSARHKANADQLAGLNAKNGTSGVSPKAASAPTSTAVNTSFTSPPPSLPNGLTADDRTAKIILGVLAAIAFIILVAWLANSGGGAATSSSYQGAEAAPIVAASPTAEALTASSQINTCWADDPADSTKVVSTDCAAAETDYRVSRVASTTAQCPGYWMEWDETSVLCLEEWPPPTFTVCFKPESDEADCTSGLTAASLKWSYSSCWEGARGVVLQQRITGEWKTVESGISKKNGCMSGYPWTVSFVRRAKGEGTKSYRLYVPAADGFTTTIENITVTVEKDS